MAPQPHPSVAAVLAAARTVLEHRHDPRSGSFWRRWFDAPHERHFADEVRTFVLSLDHLLDVPPTMLSPADLINIGKSVDDVVSRVEVAIDDPVSHGRDASALTPAVYVIRSRYEELYKRGATKSV